MSALAARVAASATAPDFCAGMACFGPAPRALDVYGAAPAIARGRRAIESATDPAAVFQTLLAADALRYLTLQVTASKASGHPGGFAGIADAVAALIMSGHKNLLASVGHHAPGFYSALFLDRSLETMGIRDVAALCERFRERDGLLGHLSGRVPGLINPAGPLGQGQHVAMAAAMLHRDTLFPVLVGDGECDEPYVASSFASFHTAYPAVTNVLPVLAWNGFSQEHHSTMSAMSNGRMAAYWRAQGFDDVLIVDAAAFDDRRQPGPFADSTRCSTGMRLEFTGALLRAVDVAERAARGGRMTILIVKQLKGAGLHARGACAHALAPDHTLAHPEIAGALEARAQHPAVWALVRANFERAGGGPAAEVVVTERVRPLPSLGELPIEPHPIDRDRQVPTAAIGRLIAGVGQRDRAFIVACSDGNAASGLAGVNRALTIAHPTRDPLYDQGPGGRVYEPVNEDACAGLTSALSLLGARALWCSYESFAVNGLPVWQTVTQAMAELRRPTPAAVALFTAGALEQGRNGWTHQRPEIEAYLAALVRNGNVFPLFPPDANSAQVCYRWALSARNKGIAIFASKSPLPIRATLDQHHRAFDEGAIVLHETPGDPTVVFAAVGDLVLTAVYDAAARLASRGIGVRVVAVVSPRRLFRPRDVAWASTVEPDGRFMSDETFDRLFGGDALVGVTGGAGAMLEPVLLRARQPRDLFCWKRGETARDASLLMAINGLTAGALAHRALELVVHVPRRGERRRAAARAAGRGVERLRPAPSAGAPDGPRPAWDREGGVGAQP